MIVLYPRKTGAKLISRLPTEGKEASLDSILTELFHRHAKVRAVREFMRWSSLVVLLLNDDLL